MSDTVIQTDFPQVHAHEDIPFNLYKQSAPLDVKVLENTKLTSPDSPNDVRHVVFSLEGTDYRYLDGQSAGIVPPGSDEAGKPHKIRLYSIASPGCGDDGAGKTLTVCVKRVVYNDPETGEERRGICSNYICDLKPGDTVNMTGPVGKAFFMPEVADANIIMIATGTGIAPFRAFLKTRYSQRAQESGQTWMIFGAPYRSDYLYESELEGHKNNPGYHLVTAFSREETTADGKKMYVQHRLTEHGQALVSLLQDPKTYLYICGLRGMETGILEGLQVASNQLGVNWENLFQTLKDQKRWRVEVY